MRGTQYSVYLTIMHQTDDRLVLLFSSIPRPMSGWNRWVTVSVALFYDLYLPVYGRSIQWDNGFGTYGT
jgi:hypothetical protein